MSDTNEPRPDDSTTPDKANEQDARRPESAPPQPEAGESAATEPPTPEPGPRTDGEAAQTTRPETPVPASHEDSRSSEVVEAAPPALGAGAGGAPSEDTGPRVPAPGTDDVGESPQGGEPETSATEEDTGAALPEAPPTEDVEHPAPEAPATEDVEHAAPEAPADEAVEQAEAPLSEEHERLAEENARRLEAEIEGLRAGWAEPGRRPFRAFFERERRLHSLFKETRPLRASDRHRLWSAFKQTGADVRRAQQEEWESRRYQSIEARETIEEKIRKAESLAQESQSGSDYRKADALLNEIRSVLGSTTAGSPGQVLIGPDRRACWDGWRAVRDVLRQRRGGLQDQDYQALDGLVTEVSERARSGDAFRAVQRVKELQARLGKAYLRRGQFEELRRRLSEAWKAAQSRVAEQREERTRMRAEWRERMEGHLTRWRETIEHKQGQREHLLGQIAKLEGMEQSARSEDFAVQVRSWKEETSDKLRRVEEFITDLEERIQSVTRKLGSRGRGEGTAGDQAVPEAAASGEARPARAPRSRRGGRRKPRAGASAEDARPEGETAEDLSAEGETAEDLSAEGGSAAEPGRADDAPDRPPGESQARPAAPPETTPGQEPADPTPGDPEREP